MQDVAQRHTINAHGEAWICISACAQTACRPLLFVFFYLLLPLVCSLSTPSMCGVPLSQSLTHALTHTTTVVARSSDELQCGFEGNDDIYGIGIRIGIYAQILAVWFANYFLFSEAQVLRDSVSIFSVALLIVAIIYASSPQDVYAVEGFVLLQILAWSCIMGVRAKSSYSKGIFSRGSFLRKSICDIVNLVNISLHVWFWWVGVGQMKKTPCGSYIMMYVLKTGMFGWARKVMMAMSLFVLCCTVYWAGVEFMRPWTMWKISKAREEFTEAVKSWEEATNGNIEVPSIAGQGKDSDCVCACADADGACSKSSSPQGSPTKSHFSIDHAATTTTTITSQAIPIERPTSGHNASPRISINVVTSPTSTHSSIEQQPNHTPMELPILREVYESEMFIQHCISASPYQLGQDGKPLALPVIIKSILFPSRYRTANVTNKPPSWFRCHLHTWALFLTFRFPPQAFIVYSHLRQSRLLDPLNGPFQLYAAVTYKSVRSADLPKWSSVSLASSLMLAAPTTPKKVWLGWYYAVLDLTIHVVVILQLELTLRWNNVSGLSSLWTSVGQLVPFIIGVCGLVLVASRWGVRVWVKWKRGAGGDSGWEKDGLLKDEETDQGQCDETFGMERHVSKTYEKWSESQKVLP